MYLLVYIFRDCFISFLKCHQQRNRDTTLFQESELFSNRPTHLIRQMKANQLSNRT